MIKADTIKRIPITKARVNFGAIVKSVHDGKRKYILEKDGYPVAAIISIDDMKSMLDTKELKQLEKILERSVYLED